MPSPTPAGRGRRRTSCPAEPDPHRTGVRAEGASTPELTTADRDGLDRGDFAYAGFGAGASACPSTTRSTSATPCPAGTRPISRIRRPSGGGSGRRPRCAGSKHGGRSRAAPLDTRVTATFQRGVVSGSAGCKRDRRGLGPLRRGPDALRFGPGANLWGGKTSSHPVACRLRSGAWHEPRPRRARCRSTERAAAGRAGQHHDVPRARNGRDPPPLRRCGDVRGCRSERPSASRAEPLPQRSPAPGMTGSPRETGSCPPTAAPGCLAGGDSTRRGAVGRQAASGCASPVGGRPAPRAGARAGRSPPRAPRRGSRELMSQPRTAYTSVRRIRAACSVRYSWQTRFLSPTAAPAPKRRYAAPRCGRYARSERLSPSREGAGNELGARQAEAEP